MTKHSHHTFINILLLELLISVSGVHHEEPGQEAYKGAMMRTVTHHADQGAAVVTASGLVRDDVLDGVNDGSNRVDPIVEYVQSESQKAATLPGSCKQFFLSECNWDEDNEKLPKDATSDMVKDAFTSCCMEGGHKDATCIDLAGEVFQMEDDITDTECGELHELYKTYLEWKGEQQQQKAALLERKGQKEIADQSDALDEDSRWWGWVNRAKEEARKLAEEAKRRAEEAKKHAQRHAWNKWNSMPDHWKDRVRQGAQTAHGQAQRGLEHAQRHAQHIKENLPRWKQEAQDEAEHHWNSAREAIR